MRIRITITRSRVHKTFDTFHINAQVGQYQQGCRVCEYQEVCRVCEYQEVGSLKLKVSLAKEPYKRDDILQTRPII